MLKYQFKQVSAATLNVTNNATASASHVPPLRRRRDRLPGGGVLRRPYTTINATNQANALSSNCVRCSSFAGAYQIVYASNRPELTPWQIQSLNAVRFKLMILRFTGLKGTALQKRLDRIADMS